MFETPVHRPEHIWNQDDDIVAMIVRLLELGGIAVEAGTTRGAAWIASTGVVRDGIAARLREGVAGMCHLNCMIAASRDPGAVHEYGYALSGDGCWYEHSWLVEDDVVVETTCARERYIGVPVSELPAAITSLMQGAEWLNEDEGAEYARAKARQAAALPPPDRHRAATLLALSQEPEHGHPPGRTEADPLHQARAGPHNDLMAMAGPATDSHGARRARPRPRLRNPSQPETDAQIASIR